MIAALIALSLQAAPEAEKPILDRYYQCLANEALELEASRERADIVARAIVHRCRGLFAEAAETLRTQKADDATAAGLEPQAAGFAERFRDYSHDHALALVVGMRARDHE